MFNFKFDFFNAKSISTNAFKQTMQNKSKKPAKSWTVLYSFNLSSKLNVWVSSLFRRTFLFPARLLRKIRKSLKHLVHHEKRVRLENAQWTIKEKYASSCWTSCYIRIGNKVCFYMNSLRELLLLSIQTSRNFEKSHFDYKLTNTGARLELNT